MSQFTGVGEELGSAGLAEGLRTPYNLVKSELMFGLTPGGGRNYRRKHVPLEETNRRTTESIPRDESSRDSGTVPVRGFCNFSRLF